MIIRYKYEHYSASQKAQRIFLPEHMHRTREKATPDETYVLYSFCSHRHKNHGLAILPT